MKFFRKKDRKKEGSREAVSALKTDIHSHILPGIDDGAGNTGDSLEMLYLLQDLGYRQVITTPHVMAGHYPNTPEDIGRAEKLLRDAMEGEGLDIEVDVAAEYMMDEGFEEVMAKQELLTFGQNYLLFECSFHQPWPEMKDYLFKLQLEGYQPVLAHVERYPYWQQDERATDELHHGGVMFQVNLMSLSGLYGLHAKRKAERLLKSGMVQFLGSDLHTARSRNDLVSALDNPMVMEHAQSMLNRSL